MNAASPIGVFDSGVGGLSVLAAIRSLLPHEDLLFVADSAHVPYGEKTPAYVQARAHRLAQFLIEQGAKVIVVACNTASAAAAHALRAAVVVPIVAMEPGVKPAAALTHTGVVGVLATAGTLQSAAFASLVERYARTVTVVAQACPGLVDQVESGDLTGLATQAMVAHYTAPLVAAGADTLVLGCTHYPFLRPLIGDAVGPGVTIVDTGTAVADHLRHVLAERAGLAERTRPGVAHFWTSGDPCVVQPVMARLWREPVALQRLPETYRKAPVSDL